MKYKLLTLIAMCLLYLNIFSQNNSSLVKNIQQINATNFVNLIQKNDTAFFIQFFNETYYFKNQKKIKRLLMIFQNELKNLTLDTKRYTQLIFPEGYNMFQFSYINSTGVLLQLEISYKEADKNSKILKLELFDANRKKLE